MCESVYFESIHNSEGGGGVQKQTYIGAHIGQHQNSKLTIC